MGETSILLLTLLKSSSPHRGAPKEYIVRVASFKTVMKAISVLYNIAGSSLAEPHRPFMMVAEIEIVQWRGKIFVFYKMCSIRAVVL